jgi:hypothetical protein
LGTAENPDAKAKASSAIRDAADTWETLEGLVRVVSIAIKALGQMSVLVQAFGSNMDVQLFLIICVLRPWLSATSWYGYMPLGEWRFQEELYYIDCCNFDQEYYTMVTNARWLSMKTLFELGTDVSFKKEVLGSNLDEYINSGTQTV